MEAWLRFPIFIAVSYVVFAAVLYLVLRRRERVGLMLHVLAIGVLVIVGGMVFAKLGQNSGWPWWVYYTVPMLLTVLLPPVYFQMNRREVPEYLVLSFLSAPVIHVLFSFLVGWKDYMPFVVIPSLWDLMG
jgi:peptidoglycan/LPS O-acetylase OafA/YrhL